MKNLSVLLFVCLFFISGCGGSDNNGDGEGHGFDCVGMGSPHPFPPLPFQNTETVVGEWECERDDGISYTENVKADGTLTLVIHNDYPNKQNHIKIWEKCRHGTKPPKYTAIWKTAPVGGNEFWWCQRNDLFRYRVDCAKTFISPDQVTAPAQKIRVYSPEAPSNPGYTLEDSLAITCDRVTE